VASSYGEGRGEGGEEKGEEGSEEEGGDGGEEAGAGERRAAASASGYYQMEYSAVQKGNMIGSEVTNVPLVTEVAVG
jgi:hypothetical protein